MEEKKVKRGPLIAVLTSASFWLAMLINIVANMGGSCVGQPVTLLAKDLGMTASAIGIVASCYTVCALLIRTPFGTVIDTAKKPTIVLCVSNIFTAIVYCGFAVCKSVPFFIVLRLLHGFTFGMRNMAMAVVLAKSIDRNAFGSALGLLTLIPKIINAIVTKVTLWIKSTAGIEYVAYAGAVLALIAGILCLFLKIHNDEASSASTKIKKKQPFYWKALPIIAVFAIIQVPSIASNSFIVLYGADVNMADAAGTYVANQSLWMGIAAFALGYITDKMSVKNAKYFGTGVCIVAALSGILVGLFQNSSLWFISGILCGIGAGGAMIYRSITLRESSPEVRALAVGSFAMSQDIIMLAGSALIGLLVDSIGYAMTFTILGLFPIISAVLTIFCFEKIIAHMQKSDEIKPEAV